MLLQASIIVTCKGRLHQLRQTLPTMLGQISPFDFEVVVVDYGCPDGTFEWCREWLEPAKNNVALSLRREVAPPTPAESVPQARSLLAVRVLDGTTPFNLSRARNIGAVHAAGSVLAFVDADMRLAPTWLAAAAASILSGIRSPLAPPRGGVQCSPLAPREEAFHLAERDDYFETAGQAGLCRPANLRTGKDRAGTCAVSAVLFHQVRGYDEQCQGWGLADGDLYRRVTRLAPCARYAPGLVWPIRHDEQLRTAHYGDDSINASAERNRAYLARRQDIVNPAGFGLGDFETMRGVASSSTYNSWSRIHRQHSRIRRLGP